MSQVSFLPPYVSTRPFARVLGALLIVTAAAAWIAVGVDWAVLQLADSVRTGAEISRGERLVHLHMASTLNTVQLVCGALTGAVFLFWLYQARVNVRALGARKLRWRREWTVLAFLIPGLNALRPYQVVREVWQASEPGARDPLSWQEQPVPPLLFWWWLTFLVFLGCEILAWAMLLGIDTAGERRIAYSLRALADVGAGVSASLAYFVTARITDAQERKQARQGRAEEPALDPANALAS